MSKLSNQAKGAIAEHYIVMRLLARGYVASNVNFSVKNSEAADILCSNEKFNKIVAVQVKSSFDSSKSFNIGLSHEDFCVDGVFDDNKALLALEQKIVCPWIFVYVDTSADIPSFRTFILKREQVIKLAFESEKWYINDVSHASPLNPKGSVSLVMGWVEGYDTPATTGKRSRKLFKNPYAVGEFEEAWHNLGID